MSNEITKGKTSEVASKIEELSLYKKTVIDAVAAKVHSYIQNGELNLPPDYSVNNAIKSAWLVLQTTVDKDKNPALQVCTRNSVANALLDMIVQGLNPTKKQNYFVVYGKQLICMRSYFGSMAVAKMVEPKVYDFAFAVVYEGDKFKYGIKNGKKTVSEHTQDIDNVDKTKIKAAYCIALDKEGNPLRTEIMTFADIKQSWKQSIIHPINEKGEIKIDTTHEKFTEAMALRTIINKTCKIIINASSDNALLLERINKNEDIADAATAQVEIDENANKGEILEIETAETTEDNEKLLHDTAQNIICPEGGVKVTEADCQACTTVATCPMWTAGKAKKKLPGF